MTSVALRRLFDHRGVLYRATAVRDEFGDTVEGWVAQDAPPGKNCRPDQTWAGAQMNRGPGEQQAQTRVWFLDRRFADVRERDVLSIVSGPETGTNVRVLSVTRPTSPYALHHIEITGEVWQEELTAPVLIPQSALLTPDPFEVEIDETTVLSVAVRDQFGDLLADWEGEVESSDEAVATVEIVGSTIVVTGVGEGSVTITLTLGNVSAEADGTVPAPPVLTTITLSPASPDVPDQEDQQFTAQGVDQYGEAFALSGVVWAVTGGIGTVTQAGLFTATTEGSGTVTATQSGVTGEAAVDVTPALPVLTTIVVTPDPASVENGEQQQFTAEGFDQYDDPFALSAPAWAVTGSVGSTDQSGLFTASAEGAGTITATEDGVIGEADIEVLPAVLFEDAFDRADGDIGNGWTESTSDWSVVGEEAASSGGFIRRITRDLGEAAVKIGVDLVVRGGAEAGVTARYVDENNHIGFVSNSTGTGVFLFKMVGAAFTSIATASVSIPDGSRVELDDRTSPMKGYIAGVEVVSGSDAAHAGSTIAGAEVRSDTARLDDFRAET